MDTRLSAPPTPNPDTAVNPFATPGGSTVSLNAPEDSVMMHETTSTLTTTTSPTDQPSLLAPKAKRPAQTLTRDTSILRHHPPPQPLDLPAPRSPPPKTHTPHANRPPEPISPPTATPSHSDPVELEQDLPPKRWWTDWLCGCREGGDHQVRVSLSLTLYLSVIVLRQTLMYK